MNGDDFYYEEDYLEQIEKAWQELEQTTCQHEWEEKSLLTTTYKVCKKCGKTQNK